MLRVSISGWVAALAIAFLSATALQAAPITVENQAISGEMSGATGMISGFTVANNSNRMLVVAVSGEVSTIDSVTYGATPLTMTANVDAATTGGPSAASIWTLDSPTAGTADINVSIGGTTNSFHIGALSLTSDGMLQVVDTEEYGSSSGGNPTLTFSPLDLADDYFMVAAAERNGNGSLSQPSGLMELYADGNMGGSATTRSDFAFLTDTMDNMFTYNLSDRHALVGIAVQATAVPEPTSVVIWTMIGLIGVAFTYRRLGRRAA